MSNGFFCHQFASFTMVFVCSFRVFIITLKWGSLNHCVLRVATTFTSLAWKNPALCIQRSILESSTRRDSNNFHDVMPAWYFLPINQIALKFYPHPTGVFRPRKKHPIFSLKPNKNSTEFQWCFVGPVPPTQVFWVGQDTFGPLGPPAKLCTVSPCSPGNHQAGEPQAWVVRW